MMTNCDPEGQIFISHPHTNGRLLFLLTIKYCIFIFNERASISSEYGEMRQIMITSL